MTNSDGRLPSSTTDDHYSSDDGPPVFSKTCEEVLEDAILELIELGYKNGMTPDDVDSVLNKIMDERAQACRAAFKMHGAEDEP